jgi:hypothetical protein
MVRATVEHRESQVRFLLRNCLYAVMQHPGRKPHTGIAPRDRCGARRHGGKASNAAARRREHACHAGRRRIAPIRLVPIVAGAAIARHGARVPHVGIARGGSIYSQLLWEGLQPRSLTRRKHRD